MTLIFILNALYILVTDKTIYVKNVPLKATRRTLTSAVKKFGNVKHKNIQIRTSMVWPSSNILSFKYFMIISFLLISIYSACRMVIAMHFWNSKARKLPKRLLRYVH